MMRSRTDPSGSERTELSSRWSEPDTQGRGSRRDSYLDLLRSKCKKDSPERPKELDLRGISLVGEDLSGLDLSHYDFSGADLTNADLRVSKLIGANLQGANLFKARLEGSELFGADLQHANLSECRAKRAGFGAAVLHHASFINADLQNATLSRSQSYHVDFRAADLRSARMAEADIRESNFTRANMQNCDLKASNVSHTSFELADLRDARILGIKNYTKASWVGTDIREIDLRGTYLIKRYISDENYLYEFKTRSKYHKILYWMWRTTSDCGRSLSRWTVWILGITILFALFYNHIEMDYGTHATPFSSYYFSVVTLTTLGFGDVVPVTITGQILVVLEATLGYIGLGGLLSILANKMARRAD